VKVWLFMGRRISDGRRDLKALRQFGDSTARCSLAAGIDPTSVARLATLSMTHQLEESEHERSVDSRSEQVGGCDPSLVVLPGRPTGLRKIRKKSLRTAQTPTTTSATELLCEPVRLRPVKCCYQNAGAAADR